jgi:hypothetical protein
MGSVLDNMPLTACIVDLGVTVGVGGLVHVFPQHQASSCIGHDLPAHTRPGPNLPRGYGPTEPRIQGMSETLGVSEKTDLRQNTESFHKGALLFLILTVILTQAGCNLQVKMRMIISGERIGSLH